MSTPSLNAVPFLRQSAASSFVASIASSIVRPLAMTADTRAPAEEPAKGVFSWKRIYNQSSEKHISIPISLPTFCTQSEVKNSENKIFYHLLFEEG